jgi:type 1 glutamine amidotransferase
MTHSRRAGTSGVWLGLFAAVAVLLLHQTGVRTKTPVAEGSAADEMQRGTAPSAKRKVVFIAGPVSHAYGSHDHWPGARLLGRMLQENHSQIEAVVHRNGWPADPTAFDGAAAIVIYADGGARHPAITHLAEMDAMMKRGVGLVLMHYAVEVEEATAGPQFLDWAGGYFKIHWSVNPHWLLQVKSLRTHPITRGVRPFETHDEWYYHMQFREGMKMVPILTALPPASSLERPEGPHQNNPHVRAAVLDRKEPQHVAWAVERADGGRGFGFTGGHWHWNWGHPMQRKLVLNAIAWAAKAEVPAAGIETPRVTMEQLEENAEETPPAAWLSTEAAAAAPAPVAGTGGRAQNLTRAQRVALLEEWHKAFPPASTIR